MSFENGMAFTINAETQEVLDVTPENGKDFKIEELYKLTNCDIVQIVEVPKRMTSPSRKHWIIVLDEEGKMHDFIPNDAATLLYQDSWDIIVGDVLVCPTTMVK